MEKDGRDDMEERKEAEASGEYRRMREEFVSLIHSFFAQAALVAAGAPLQTLPNPETIEPLLKANAPLSESSTMSKLDLAEDLMRSLRTNVNDELALRVFCLNVALKA